MALEYDHEDSIYEYADYMYKTKSFESALMWYKKIFDSGNYSIISNWVKSLIQLKQFDQLKSMIDELESHYDITQISFQISLIKLYSDLAIYYKTVKDDDNVYKYYLKGIILSDSNALTNLEQFV